MEALTDHEKEILQKVRKLIEDPESDITVGEAAEKIGCPYPELMKAVDKLRPKYNASDPTVMRPADWTKLEE